MRRPIPPLALLTLVITGLGLLHPTGPARAGGVLRHGTPAARPLLRLQHAGPDYNHGRPLPIAPGSRERFRGTHARVRPQGEGGGPAGTPRVGEVRTWLALDDVSGNLYAKDFTLRGVGEHIEVWVASGADRVSRGLDYPAGDCRNGHRTRISDTQVRSLITEFDQTIHPVSSAAFSTLVPRDGSRSTLPRQLGLPADYFTGAGDRVVTLVDNVRDADFYDRNGAQGLGFVAGFFYSTLSSLVDRNVMTVDGFDWLHRTGEDPPDEPSADPCATAPAQPRMLESVFAHEYQHLLAHDRDPGEAVWLNEGLSSWAETITGYARPATPITEAGFSGHVQCFLGHLGRAGGVGAPLPGGPENSLTRWGDQGMAEIPCDYGAARTMVGFLAGRYGAGMVRALHLDPAHGLASVRAQLARFDPGVRVEDVVHDWAAMVALDAVVDDGADLHGGDPERLTEPTLDAGVNWDSPHAHTTPGAPPNGSDYVRLRGPGGRPLAAEELSSLAFDGADGLPPSPVEWTVDRGAPGRAGNPALHSGSGLDLERSIVREVTVPPLPARGARARAGTPAPTLTFDTYYSLESGFDFGFVQVSTDAGRTWQSLAGTGTTGAADPAVAAPIRRRLPGLTGVSRGPGGDGKRPAWVRASFDLRRYAGRRILVGFAYATDSWQATPGWWVDDVRVGNTLLTDGADLARWRSASQVRPVPVAGFEVRLVAYSSDHERAWLARLPLGQGHAARLDRTRLRSALGDDADVVAAIVTYDEPTELRGEYAPYHLTVNGVPQPGGTAKPPSRPQV